MVTLLAGQPEEPLLEDGIATVPKGERETKALMIVADAEDAIFAPAIGLRSGVVMRKVIPSRAIGGIVFAHRAPLTLRKIGSPASPMLGALRGLIESFPFSIHLL